MSTYASRPLPSRFTVHLPCRWRVVGTDTAPLGPVVARGKIGLVFSPLFHAASGHPVRHVARPAAIWWTIKDLLFNDQSVEGLDGRWNITLGTPMDLMIDFPPTTPITRSVWYSRYATRLAEGIRARGVEVLPTHSTWGDALEVLDLFTAIFAWQYPGSEIDYLQAREDWDGSTHEVGPVPTRFLVDLSGSRPFRQEVLVT